MIQTFNSLCIEELELKQYSINTQQNRSHSTGSNFSNCTYNGLTATYNSYNFAGTSISDTSTRKTL